MGIDINWGLLQPQTQFNPAQATQAGYQLGQQRAQMVQAGAVKNALAQYGANPNGAINALIGAGAVSQANALTSMRTAQQSPAMFLKLASMQPSPIPATMC